MRILVIAFLLIAGPRSLMAQVMPNVSHTIAAIEQDRFHGWPANNGVWRWGDEILVGYTQGDYARKSGHNISGMQESLFARSTDGGGNWVMFDPDNFLDDENEKWLPKGKKHLEQPVDFTHEGFAMRIFATGYHGNDDPAGGFYYSYDRGSTWFGPYFLGHMHNDPQLAGLAITARTDYIVTGPKEIMIFISTSNGKVGRIGCIKSEDGGMSFRFVSWITPESERENAIMSSTVRLDNKTYILAYRLIYPALKNKKGNQIKTFISKDGCRSWQYLSTVKIFESSSNPPALLSLKDGRLLCVYGDRHNSRMAGRYSRDQGRTWGAEFIFRDQFKDANSDWDFGYPRLVQRTDGKVVAMYYWASPENPQQHIAASIWDPNQTP